jgi:hypothetical protein
MSRSVQNDYEKARNPGNTRKLGPEIVQSLPVRREKQKYKVRQCACYHCRKVPFTERHWSVINAWGGAYNVNRWELAVSHAQRLAAAL